MLLTLDLLHTQTGFVGQRLEFKFFQYSEKLIFFSIKSICVYLLKLRGFLVECEARSIDFSDFSGTEPVGWTPSTHQRSERSIGDWSEEE